MDDSLYRLTIGHGDRTADVVLPGRLPLGALLPAIVDLVADRDGSDPQLWRVHRAAGGRLDESMTLYESGIHDGDVLTVSGSGAPDFIPTAGGSFRTVVGATAIADHGMASSVVSVWAVMAVAVALICSLVVGGHPMIAAAATGSAAVASVLVSRMMTGVAGHTTVAVIGVLSSAVCGHLALSPGANESGLLLASAAAAMTAAAHLRLTRGSPAVLTAFITFAMCLTVVVAPMVIWSLGPTAAAALLCVTALAAMGAAPRLTVSLTGLTPSISGRAQVSDARAEHCRRVLGGIVAGSGSATVTGCGVIAVSGADRPVIAATLIAVASAILLLRARGYADPIPQAGLTCCGMIGATACLVALISWFPLHAGWIAATAVGIVGTVYLQRGTLGPTWLRGVDAIEYVLLIALLPLSAWAAGLFGIARGADLPW